MPTPQEIAASGLAPTRTALLNDILIHALAHPGAEDEIDRALAWAKALGAARVSAAAFHVDFPSANSPLANQAVAGMASELEARSLQAARSVLEHFKSRAGDQGVLGETLLGRAQLYAVGDSLALSARSRDLCLISVGVEVSEQRQVSEAVVFGSGRPVLLLPKTPAPASGLNRVLVAWDGSRTAARTLADALPVLRAAREVQVFTVLSEKTSARAGMAAEAARHLGAHGIAATAREVDAKGRRIGAVLDALVKETGADLLVMGAYGRSRVREFLLGGATEHVLTEPPTALLLSH